MPGRRPGCAGSASPARTSALHAVESSPELANDAGGPPTAPSGDGAAQPSPEPKLPCAGQLPLFFSRRKALQAEARSICATCPARAACLEYALTVPEAFGHWGGIWAGTTPAERRSIRAERQAGAA